MKTNSSRTKREGVVTGEDEEIEDEERKRVVTGEDE